MAQKEPKEIDIRMSDDGLSFFFRRRVEGKRLDEMEAPIENLHLGDEVPACMKRLDRHCSYGLVIDPNDPLIAHVYEDGIFLNSIRSAEKAKPRPLVHGGYGPSPYKGSFSQGNIKYKERGR